MAWLSTLGETDGPAFYPVIDAVAVVDLPRAIELDAWAIELDYGGRNFGDLSWLETGLRSHRYDPGRIADLVAGSPSQGLLANVLRWWAIRDPYDAIRWMTSQRTISSLAVGRVATELARQDFGRALGYSELMPPALRAAWIEEVLTAPVPFDPYAAMSWVGGLPDDALRERMMEILCRRTQTCVPPR